MVTRVSARIVSILLETDLPDLVMAGDLHGSQYLCCLVSRDDDGDRFLCTQISNRRLASFRAGRVDLRAIIAAPATGKWFDGWYKPIDGQAALELTEITKIPDTWIPDEGFFLSDFTGAVERGLLGDARSVPSVS